PQDGESARPRGAADAARPRRRGDRMSGQIKRREFITLLSGVAAAPAGVVADVASGGERLAKSFKDYEQEGWSKKASQYGRLVLPLTSQAFEPILASFGGLTGKRLLDVCTGPGHLAGGRASGE